ADFEAPAREPVPGLQRLVAIGDAAEDPLLPLPLRGVERLAEQLGGVLLDHDLAIEIGARAEAQVLVRRPCVAIRTGVKAAAVRVDAPVEADIGAVVVR